MLSKIAGVDDFSRIIKGKSIDIISEELSTKSSKICPEDMFVKASTRENNLMKFLDPKEIEDAKKLLNKPTGEGFDILLKHECDILKDKG